MSFKHCQTGTPTVDGQNPAPLVLRLEHWNKHREKTRHILLVVGCPKSAHGESPQALNTLDRSPERVRVRVVQVPYIETVLG